jgi:hypothetical protein
LCNRLKDVHHGLPHCVVVLIAGSAIAGARAHGVDHDQTERQPIFFLKGGFSLPRHRNQLLERTVV